jgi:hypothetical protein
MLLVCIPADLHALWCFNATRSSIAMLKHCSIQCRSCAPTIPHLTSNLSRLPTRTILQHNDRNNHARPGPRNKLHDTARCLLFWSWDVTHYVQTNDGNHGFGIKNKDEGTRKKVVGDNTAFKACQSLRSSVHIEVVG